MDTLSVLERVRFCQSLSNNMNDSSGAWGLEELMARKEIESAEELIDYFNELLFQGLLADGQRKLFLRFVQTDEDGNPSPLDDMRESRRLERLQQMVALILSSPGFHFQ